MVQGDAVYAFRVTMRNVLNEKAYADIFVSLVADAVPTFVLAGASQRTIRRTQDVTIAVAVVKFPCGVSASALKLEWTDLTGMEPLSVDLPFQAVEYGGHHPSTSAAAAYVHTIVPHMISRHAAPEEKR